MKYHLLNLAAIASIVIAGGTAMQHLLPGQSSSPLEPTTTMSHQEQQDEDCTNNNTTSSSSSSNNDSPVAAPSRNLRQDCENDAADAAAATAPSRPQQQQQEPLPFIKRGSIVELYSDTSYFAIPAIVLETSSSSNNEEDDEEYTITVENTITHETLPISSQFIHPYTPYPDNSRASCNIAMDNDTIYMTPCAIISHMVRENSGLVLYEVSYLDNEENLVEEYMPFMRVQRVHGRRNGSMLRASNVAAATAR